MTNRLTRGAIGLLAGTAALCAASLAGAEPIKPGQQQGLGLTGADIPDELKKISADPYAAPGDCEQINREIAVLDDILGPDRDSGEQQNPSLISTTVMPIARSFIPYRNVVRLVTGANRKDAQLTQAAMAGWERRGFLKGLQKHCGAPHHAEVAAAAAPGEPAPPPIRPEDLQLVADADAPPPAAPPADQPILATAGDPAVASEAAYVGGYPALAQQDPGR